jgi:hypothetical protein
MPTVSGTCTLTGADCAPPRAPCAAAIAVESLEIHVSQTHPPRQIRVCSLENGGPGPGKCRQDEGKVNDLGR